MAKSLIQYIPYKSQWCHIDDGRPVFEQQRPSTEFLWSKLRSYMHDLIPAVMGAICGTRNYIK